MATTLINPRFFAPLASARLLPSRLGKKNHAATVRKLIERRGPTCEISGLALSPQGLGATLEFRDPQAATHSGAIRLANIRLVDEWVFWSRHVELAIEEEMGSLIFMPWMGQLELLKTTRMLRVGLRVAQQRGWTMMEEIATKHLTKLSGLGQDSMMLAALGLPEDIEQWKSGEWLAAIRQMPIRERKTYMQRFGRHVRYLPNLDQETAVVDAWRGLAGLGKDEDKALLKGEELYTNALKAFTKQEAKRSEQNRSGAAVA